METWSTTMAPESTRTRKTVVAIGLFGVVFPVLSLGLIYGFSLVAGVNFGNLIFGLSILTTGGWIVVGVWGGRLDAARPSGELFRLSATAYGSEINSSENPRIALPARVLIVLTATVVFGWAILLMFFL